MTEMERRRRQRNQKSRFRSLLRVYRFELIWAAVILVGAFLIFERMSIRQTLLRWLSAAAQSILRSIGQLDDGVRAFLDRTSVSDAIGYLLVVGAMVALLWRLRWRLLHSPTLTAMSCPKCGGAIHRAHRTTLDHIINVYVPIRRYRCANRECRWHGLRVGMAQSFPASRPKDERR